MKKTTTLYCVLLLIAHAALAQRKEPVNVIVIMADQLRYDVIGDLTPNISALRAEGVSFDRAYCASPICVPSRGSFFTGMYPNRTGSIINGWDENDMKWGRVKAGIPNLYTLMENKWDSWHVGKQHFLTSEKIDQGVGKTRWITQEDYGQWAKKQGVETPGGKRFQAMVPEMVSGEQTHTRAYSVPVFERYAPGPAYFLDHYIASESVNAIKNRDKKKPLLLNAMFLAPHPPFHVPEPYFSMFDKEDITVPANVGVWYSQQSPLQLYNITGFLGTRYNREEWSKIWKKYLGLVKLLDDEVGRIIRTLKDEGLYESSIIIFTADHGEMLGSHLLWQKMCMYEESSRVPLFIKFPGSFVPAVEKVDIPVSLVDVFPTLMEFNDLKTTAVIDGHSLLPIVRGQKSDRPPVFIQYDGNGSLGNFQRCLVRDKFKLIVDIFKNEIFLELYDVISDPLETRNLAFAKENSATTRELLKLLKNEMTITGDRLKLPENLQERFLAQYRNILLK
jgi:arylsulfatase A-like enzyme